MTLFELLILLLIAGVCGAIGQSIAGFSRGGCLVAVVVGYIGAMIGSRLAVALNLPEPFLVAVGGSPFPILWSIIGATLFAIVVGLLTRGRNTPV